MNLKEVHRVLQDMFDKELTDERKRHLVFWYDQEGDFTEDIDRIQLEGVRKWQVTENNLFATKYELEKNDLNSHFLIYANMAKPSPREDWLYDLYKLGSEFATDKTTIIMRELGITDDALRGTFIEYKQFFNNRRRFQTFQKYPVESYTAEIVDLTVLATLTKSRTNTIDDIMKALLGKRESAWDNILKFGNVDAFWSLVEKNYGYILSDKTIESLTTFLMLTYVSSYNTSVELPAKWTKYISSRPTNVVVFIDQWMNHRADKKLYDDLANHMADQLKIDEIAVEWDSTDIIHMDAFKVFDEQIIQHLVDQLLNDVTAFDVYQEMISIRKRLHWYIDFKHEYEAIGQAVQLIRLIHEQEQFIQEESAYDMFQTYINEYYLIDMAYRKFYVAYDQIEETDRLHNLREKIENLYSNWYMEELAVKWSSSLQGAEEFIWPISGLMQQSDFYQNWVHPYEENDERLFVIISDGLRYEVAKELMDLLNNERKASTEIVATQSVLPSYTALGMASLLPYQQMEYSRTGQVFTDGMNTSSTSSRNKIIQQSISESIAIQYHDVIGMNRATFRESFQGKKIVYIYHNTIDASGDNPANEMNVFQASAEAIHDIRTLINRLVNNISASNIIITADHGFIYQRDPITKSQKVPQHLDETIVTNRRFMLTEQDIQTEETLTYSMDYILNQEEELSAIVPKGANRFAVQGAGANYVHGGAMLQEIVIPVITFKNDRSHSSENQVKTVDVKLTSATRKITSTITYLEFFQTVRIEEKTLPLQLRAYFVDENGERISNEVKMIADSRSNEAAGRVFKEKFVFRAEAYDKRKTYELILEDDQTENIYERYSFIIDIAFMDQ